jgi:hypothetical protein
MYSHILYKEKEKEMYPNLIPDSNQDLYCIKREDATVSQGFEQYGMILDPGFDEAMKDGNVMHEDEDIVTRLAQVYKEIEQFLSNSTKALSCSSYNHAKKIIRILGRTLVTQIMLSMWDGMGYERSMECMDNDETHGLFTQKTTTMRRIFESACETLKGLGKEVTCYSVFAQFLESMGLGWWEGDKLRTIAVNVDEYIGSDVGHIITDKWGAQFFADYKVL